MDEKCTKKTGIAVTPVFFDGGKFEGGTETFIRIRVAVRPVQVQIVLIRVHVQRIAIGADVMPSPMQAPEFGPYCPLEADLCAPAPEEFWDWFSQAGDGKNFLPVFSMPRALCCNPWAAVFRRGSGKPGDNGRVTRYALAGRNYCK
jgi:hypothetical protein